MGNKNRDLWYILVPQGMPPAGGERLQGGLALAALVASCFTPGKPHGADLYVFHAR